MIAANHSKLCDIPPAICVTDICDTLRDLVIFVQFKKREKHSWRSVNFSKVAGFSLLKQPYHINTWHLSAFLYTLQAHISSPKTHPVRYTSSTTRLNKVPNPRIPRKFDVIQVIWENKLTDFYF